MAGMDRRVFLKLASGAGMGLYLACKGAAPAPPRQRLTFTPETIADAFTMENTDRALVGAAELPYLSSDQQAVVGFSTEQGGYACDQSMLGELSPTELLVRAREAIGEGDAAVELYFQQPVRMIGLLPAQKMIDFLSTLGDAYHGRLPRTLSFEGRMELGAFGRAIDLTRATLGKEPLLPEKAYLLGPQDLTEDYGPLLRK